MKRVFIPLTNDEVDEIGLIDARIEVRRLNRHIDTLNAERDAAIAAAVAAERERCAKIAEGRENRYKSHALFPAYGLDGMACEAHDIAAAIRAR